MKQNFEFLFQNGKLICKFFDAGIQSKIFCVENENGKYKLIDEDITDPNLHKGQFPRSGFLFFNSKNDQLTISPDDWGRVPMFFYSQNNYLFCTNTFSEILEKFDLEIDNNQILQQLFFGHSFSGKTIFKKVFVLPPHQKIVFKNGNMNMENNDLNIYGIEDNHDQSIEQLDYEISKVFFEYFDNAKNNEFTLSLTGGLDSRLLMAKYIEYRSHKINCFTYGTRKDRDVLIARRIAQDYKYNHNFFEITPDDFIKNAEEYILFTGGTNSLTNSRAFHIYREFSSDQIIVNGFGGDLTLGGGFHKRELLEHNDNDFLMSYLFSKFCKIDPDSFSNLSNIGIRDLQNMFINEVEPLFTLNTQHGSLPLKADKILLLSKVIFYGYWSVLFSAQKAKVITPMFDPRLNNYFLSIDSKSRYKHTLYKNYFINKFPELAKYPWQKFGVNLFDERSPILDQDNNRRIPYQSFWQEDLRLWIRDVLFSNNSYLINVININKIKKMLNDKKPSNDWADFIGQILSIELLITYYKKIKLKR